LNYWLRFHRQKETNKSRSIVCGELEALKCA